jgi:signal peptidase I
MKFFIRLFSKSAREAHAMCKHVRKLLNEQRDLLAPKAIEEIEAAIRSTETAAATKSDKAALEKEMENLEKIANKWIKPHQNAVWRENVEVLLVALAVAMAIRTFFLQPFKIPTGSMQPTLYGVTSTNLLNNPDFKFPTGLPRVREWFEGISYIHVVAKNDGELQSISQPVRFLIFNIKQTIWIGGVAHTLWFPPDCGESSMRGQTALQNRAGLQIGQVFHQGEDVLKLQVRAGDHLFVDRITYNFCPPGRGEIIVFETKGISEDRRNYFGIPADQFYIKRLVGLSGETISLEPDYEVTGTLQGDLTVGHLKVNGQPLSSATPHFENLYSFANAPRKGRTLIYQENSYYGHAMFGELSPGREFKIQPEHYFVMGDNTMNSLDSRYWGDFPSNTVIGKSFFVYWPITKRFGWGQQ